MKKQAIMVAVMLTALLCASGCGKPADTTSSPVKVTVEAVNNKSLEELHSIYEGTWEVSVVFVDNHDGIQFDADKYQFKEDETGSFIPKNGKREKISWSVTPDGDLKIVFEEREGKTQRYEYVGGNLVNFEKEDRGVVETHLAKTADLSSPDTQNKKP